MFNRYGDIRASKAFKKSPADIRLLSAECWPPGAAGSLSEQNLKSTAQIFIRLNHDKPTAYLIFKLRY